MAGDSVRDAFRTELQTILTGAGITIPFVDDLNTDENPDASAAFIDMTFGGGDEGQITFGAPGNNIWRETGQVVVDFMTPLGVDRDATEHAAELARTAFKGRRFAAGSTTIEITNAGPLGGQGVGGGMWAESFALSYQRYTTG